MRLQQTLTSAYIFHPNIQTVEADKQMLIWTKTLPIETPPSVFTNLMKEVNLEPIKNIMETTILASRLYEKREVKKKSKNKPKDLTKGTHENFPSSLLQNQFKNVMGFARTYPQLRNLNPVAEVQVSASWKVQGEVLSVYGKPGTFINSKRSVPQFYGLDIVEESKNVPLGSFAALGPIHLFTDLTKYLIRETACTGFIQDKAFFPHFHTLFLIDNGDYKPPPSKGVPEIQMLQRGLLFTFARLLAQAVSKHGNEILGNVLPEPECAQCILTDGNRFSFLWYQLNTLDTNDPENGVKNVACMVRPGEVFTTIAEDTKILQGVNEEVLRMYLTMLLI